MDDELFEHHQPCQRVFASQRGDGASTQFPVVPEDGIRVRCFVCAKPVPLDEIEPHLKPAVWESIPEPAWTNYGPPYAFVGWATKQCLLKHLPVFAPKDYSKIGSWLVAQIKRQHYEPPLKVETFVEALKAEHSSPEEVPRVQDNGIGWEDLTLEGNRNSNTVITDSNLFLLHASVPFGNWYLRHSKLPLKRSPVAKLVPNNCFQSIDCLEYWYSFRMGDEDLHVGRCTWLTQFEGESADVEFLMSGQPCTATNSKLWPSWVKRVIKLLFLLNEYRDTFPTIPIDCLLHLLQWIPLGHYNKETHPGCPIPTVETA
eukprot:TRINITY_DN24420_c0_g1_i1.p1 TRINITY_DN24420_c0_g1~~TRINITY_DN24420_c0_g1_i1.p1  ORF type:complete len:315 (-),score=27.02 TRINITY_DN24420_c0_g1_i1:117-1061(-)